MNLSCKTNTASCLASHLVGHTFLNVFLENLHPCSSPNANNAHLGALDSVLPLLILKKPSYSSNTFL